jgi:hypothetical protein
MIAGMTTSTFTLVHVLLSLVGIGAGLAVVFGLLTGERFNGWTAIFLAATAATSLTGFMFPFDHLLPSHKVGVISLWCWRLRSWPVTYFILPGRGVRST